MSITKEQWKEIEQSLSNDMYISVRFEYKGFELSIQRLRIKENKLVLRVFINDEMKGSWFVDAINGKESEVSTIFKDVYKEVSKALYSPTYIKRLEKNIGKRKLKELIPDLHERHSYWLPDFSKASVLCRQYKKLGELTLLSM